MWVWMILRTIEYIGYIPMLYEIIKAKGTLNGVPERVFGVAIKNLIIHMALYFIFENGTDKLLYNYLRDLNKGNELFGILIVGMFVIVVFHLIFSFAISIYTIIGFIFWKSNIIKIEVKMVLINSKCGEIDNNLRKKATYVNRVTENQKWTQNIRVGVSFAFYNINVYILKIIYRIRYTIYFLKLHLIKYLKSFLQTSVYNRFCHVFKNILTVVMLIIVNIYLYINFSESELIIHFYELLSTVIIIPIFLDKISEQG